MGNNCLIDLPSYDTWDSAIHENKNEGSYRLTEGDILRITEDSIFRIEA